MAVKSSNRRKGRFAELHAAAFLCRQGCRILARNYAYCGGELDIVARNPVGKWLFVEVKSVWKKNMGSPSSRVQATKQHRIWKTACHFLHHHGGPDQESRFDVIAVDMRSGHPNIQYYPGAFEARATIAQC